MMASLKETVGLADMKITDDTPKVATKSKVQKQCHVKPKKKTNLLSKTNVWQNSNDKNGCFRLRKTPARSKHSDGYAGNSENKLKSIDTSRTTLVSECLVSSAPETQRDWEKEGGKPKNTSKKSTFTRDCRPIPQERLIIGEQVKKPTTKKSQASQNVQKKHTLPWKSNGNKKDSHEKNVNQTTKEIPNRHSSKNKEYSNVDDKNVKTKKHSQNSKNIKTSRSGKREHPSTSDSQSPSDESQLSPRNETHKGKKTTQHRTQNQYHHQSKSLKKRSKQRTDVESEPVLPVLAGNDGSDHSVSIDPQPAIPQSGRFHLEDDSDWDDLDPLSESFSEVTRPLIEFHRHFLSTVLAEIFSSSDWDSDDSSTEDDNDDDNDVQISNENNTAGNCEYSSSEDSDSYCEDHFSRRRYRVSDEGSSQPDIPRHFHSDLLMASGYHSEHSAEDSDISEDDLIYRVAEDYDDVDPLLSSLMLGIPQLSVSVWEFIMHQQLFAEDAANTLYENIIMTLASHPEFQNDGAPLPASDEIITALPSVRATKKILGDNISCAICRSEYDSEEKLTQLPCKHMFHPICIAAWLHKSGTCPVCRFHLQSSPTSDET